MLQSIFIELAYFLDLSIDPITNFKGRKRRIELQNFILIIMRKLICLFEETTKMHRFCSIHKSSFSILLFLQVLPTNIHANIP